MRMARAREWLPLVVLAVSASLANGGESKPTLPKQIGGLAYKDAKKFKDRALGVALTYQREKSVLTIFIYNGGLSDIPIGIDTGIALKQFEQAKVDVSASTAWTKIRLESDGEVLLGSKAKLKAYLALFQATAGDAEYYSILYLTAGRNLFYKARLTTPAGSDLLEPEGMAQFRQDLGDFIISWFFQ
jgi:hypothetical protein